MDIGTFFQKLYHNIKTCRIWDIYPKCYNVTTNVLIPATKCGSSATLVSLSLSRQSFGTVTYSPCLAVTQNFDFGF